MRRGEGNEGGGKRKRENELKMEGERKGTGVTKMRARRSGFEKRAD